MSAREDPALPLTLHVGAWVRDGKYIIEIDGTPIGLTFAAFEFVLELSGRRRKRWPGYTLSPADPAERNALHQLVHRLRRTIDRALRREGVGAELIRRGPRSAYYLSIPASAITIDPAIAELAPYLRPGLLEHLVAGPSATTP